MSSTVMMDRTTVGIPGMQIPGMGTGPMGAGTTAPVGPNYLMVPRCTISVEKTTGGMKIHCVCDDATACSMLQNLCSMLAGGMCSCCCMLNGMTVCTCNLTMGLCKIEMTQKGCTITCTSGDKSCGEMIQGCCECLSTMIKGGCTCCILLNNTPICCGSSETTPAKSGK